MSQTETPSEPPFEPPLGPARPHRPADDEETVYFEGSPLMRGELGTFLLCIVGGAVLMAAPFIYNALQDPAPPWWVYLICILAGLAVWAIPWVVTRSVRYRVTNYRIDYERGVLTRQVDTIELWHVDDVSFKQGLIDRVLGVGDITVLSDDKTTPRLTLDGVPNPRPLFDQLKQRIIAVKRQRGVIKMDNG